MPIQRQQARDIKHRPAKRLALIGIGGLLALLVTEVALRMGTWERGEARDVMLMDIRLMPLEVPTEGQVRALGILDQAVYEVADPELGWAIRPDAHDPRHGWWSDNLGCRSAEGAHVGPKRADERRVLILGNSFAFSDEVGWNDTLAARLGVALGEGWTVINGGVRGYGQDQALLRGRTLLGPADPDIVVMVVVADEGSNLNLFRCFYLPWTNFPLSKPRFLLDGPGLRLINSPTVPADRVLDVLADFENFPLAEHEFFWNPRMFEDHWWYASRTAAYLWSRKLHEDAFHKLVAARSKGGVAEILNARILAAWQEDVRGIGARPVCLMLYTGPELESVERGDNPLANLEQQLDAYGVDDRCNPTQTLIDHGPVVDLYIGDPGHLTGEGNRLVGEVLARWIEAGPR